MFVGEALLLLILRVRQARSPDKEDVASKRSEEVSPIILAIPATIDMLASTLGFVGLYLLDASTYQILKTLLVIYLPIVSIVAFKRKYDMVQWLSVLTVVLGIGIVAKQAGSSESKGNPILGLLCMFIGQFIQACQFVFEEWLLKDKSGQDPFYVYGWEGIWGMLFTVSLMTLFNVLPCPLSED